MPTEKGLSSSVEFTKHLMTLSGAGIAFIASLNASAMDPFQRVVLGLALVFLGISLGAGLFVWSRAVVMLSAERYSLKDKHLRVPGLINVVSFGAGVAILAIYVVLRLYDPPSAPPLLV